MRATLVAIAACSAPATPVVANRAGARPARPTLLVLAEGGVGEPIACAVPGASWTNADACRTGWSGTPRMRTPTGDVDTFGWQPGRGTCPWQTTEDLTRGAFDLCGNNCDHDLDDTVGLIPASTSAMFVPLLPLLADSPAVTDVAAALATEVHVEPATVTVKGAVSAGDLRVITISRPRPHPHPETPDDEWTAVVRADGTRHVLARAECAWAPGELVGVIDVGGRRSLVMRYQYQLVIFDVDGAIRFEGPACCGLG